MPSKAVVEGALAESQPGGVLVLMLAGRDAGDIGEEVPPRRKIELPHRPVDARKAQVRR
jgi:hypothetical protein